MRAVSPKKHLAPSAVHLRVELKIMIAIRHQRLESIRIECTEEAKLTVVVMMGCCPLCFFSFKHSLSSKIRWVSRRYHQNQIFSLFENTQFVKNNDIWIESLLSFGVEAAFRSSALQLDLLFLYDKTSTPKYNCSSNSWFESNYF